MSIPFCAGRRKGKSRIQHPWTERKQRRTMTRIVFVPVSWWCRLPHAFIRRRRRRRSEAWRRTRGSTAIMICQSSSFKVLILCHRRGGNLICPQHLTQKRSFTSMSSSVIQQVTTTPFSKWVPASGCYIESQLTFPSRLNDPWLYDIVAGGCWNDKSHASQEDQKGEGTGSRVEGEQFAKKHELHVWR